MDDDITTAPSDILNKEGRQGGNRTMTTTLAQNSLPDCKNDQADSTTPLLHNDESIDATLSKHALTTSKDHDISGDRIINNNIFEDDEEMAMIGIREPPFRRYKRRTCTPVRCLACLAVLLTLMCLTLVIMILFYDRVMPSVTTDKDIAHFYHMTDFHLDLKYNASSPSSTFCRYNSDPNTTVQTAAKRAYYGRIGCDSPKTLIDNALVASKVIPLTTQQHIDFVLASGDFVCHGLSGLPHDELHLRVLNSITHTSTRLLQAFPAIPVFPAVGNNDVIGDYLVPYGDSHWYETVFSIWSSLILCPLCPDHLRPITSFDDIRQTFLQGGYYKVEIYGGKLAIISLNTLYWDTEVIQRSNIPHDVFFRAADQQLAWFKLQLEIASNNSQSVIIEGHVPPGVDTYLGSKKDYLRYWFTNYTAVYTHYVATLYPHVIVGQFFAHMHKDDFRLLRDINGMSSFMLLAPSISPIYSNNPSFRLMTLHKKDWKLLDYVQYYLDIDLATAYNQTDWVEGYQFSTAYPSNNKYINTERIEELSNNLINPLKVKYWLNYVVSRQVQYQFSAKMRFVYYCAVEFIQYRSFTACLDAHNLQ